MTRNSLNDLMEFDHVVRVHDDGTITEPAGIHAPEVFVGTDDDGSILPENEREMLADLKRAGWSLMRGYTGQSGYRGPIMHPSEYIGGGLERDIRAAPGWYVAVVVETADSDDPAGWAVAYREDDE